MDTHSYSFNPDICLHIHSACVPSGCLIKQAGIIIHTILNMWEAPGIEPVTSGLTSVYQTSSSSLYYLSHSATYNDFILHFKISEDFKWRSVA